MENIKLKKISFTISRNDLIAFIGALYLFLSMQPFFLWSIPAVSLVFLGLFLILLCLVVAEVGFSIKRNKYFILSISFIYSTYLALPLFGHELLLGKLLLFLPLFLLFILPPKTLLRIFQLWKKILIIFSIYALVVYILFALEVDMPHWVIEDSEYIPITSRDKHFYRVYGLVVSSTNSLWRIGDIITMRLCGPFAEPGHFGIYIGFTMLIDRLLGKKINVILLIAGVLTLSPAFLIILLIIELYRIIVEKRFNLKLYIAILLTISIISIFKGTEIKDRILYITVKRHADLDKRSPLVVRKEFRNITKSPKVVVGIGTKEFNTFGGSLSDPRGMIAKFGLIGLLLSLSLIFLLLTGIKKKYAIFLAAAVVLVYLHRVWMFESTYIYTFMILAAASIKVKEDNKLIRSA